MLLQIISVKTHCFHQKILSLHYQFKRSLGRCRIKNRKETRSFPTRNPFILYSSLFYWLSERYKILKSFMGIAFARKESPSVVFQKYLAIVETSAANEWSSASFKPSSFISSVLKGSVCSSQNEEQRYPEVRNWALRVSLLVTIKLHAPFYSSYVKRRAFKRRCRRIKAGFLWLRIGLFARKAADEVSCPLDLRHGES